MVGMTNQGQLKMREWERTRTAPRTAGEAW